MFRLSHRGFDGTRRDWLRVGALSCLGATGLRASAVTTPKRAKHVIVLFLMGGPPQHSTWDPKPNAPANVRGDFGPMATKVPGLQICSLFPHVAKIADKLCFLRAVTTDDNAHSSSGYAMLTGVPHAPKNAENVNPGAPNDWPTLGGLVRKLAGDRGGLPGAVRLPMRVFNTDQSVWPGQDAGFLGRAADPWLLRCEPNAPAVRVPEFALDETVPPNRFSDRRDLLKKLDRDLATSGLQSQAFDLLTSANARAAFDLTKESDATRDRYGRSHFGQSCLLARRLTEAGVPFVHVNWYRGPEEPPDNPCWDSHTDESKRLKDVLAPTADRAMAALIGDLSERGRLDETMVLVLSEFGRTPKFNARAGRDHWGHCFSAALAGGGVRGGMVYGASDPAGAYPLDGRVLPQDLTATVLHQLGLDPAAEIRDNQGRPIPASRGDVLTKILT
jgi:arylsulfatase A-like enzyme